MLSKQCKLQLETENKTPQQHFRDAVRRAVKMQLLVPVLLVHAIAPRCFSSIASKEIDRG